MRNGMTGLCVGVALMLGSACQSAGGLNCGPDCLDGHLSDFLAALQKHDHSGAKLGESFRATENGVEVARGDGIAKSLTALGDVQRRYFDPLTGQAAYLGTVREGASVALAGIRIRVQTGEIVESETFIARQGDALFSPEGFAALPPRVSTPLPAAKRRPRDEMIAVANSYFEGLATHDSSKVPRIKGCDRLENGTRVTNRPALSDPRMRGLADLLSDTIMALLM